MTSKGFTLIEMSIVLVIIGLVVGGVLVGQNLIASSQLRAQATQFEKFNQAVNAFRTKFDCLPGDCANATNFLSNIATLYGAGNGNGDGVLEDATGGGGSGAYPALATTEPIEFWIQLFAAGLTDCCAASTYNGSFVIGTNFPQAKMGSGGIIALSLNSQNGYYWGIGQNTGVAGWSDSCGGTAVQLCDMSLTNTGVITPAQAQAFDSKIDDGLPSSGRVYAAWSYGGDNKIHPVGLRATNCVLNATITSPYAISNTQAQCSLFLLMQ